jgi:hypothetical protein
VYYIVLHDTNQKERKQIVIANRISYKGVYLLMMETTLTEAKAGPVTEK